MKLYWSKGLRGMMELSKSSPVAFGVVDSPNEFEI